MDLDDLSEEDKEKVINGKIDGLEKEYQYWKEKSELETLEPQKEIYKNMSEIAKLQADKMRLENNQRPKSEEGIKILNQEIDQIDLSRLERFKKFAKENLLGLSSVSIAIAGIITTVVVASRNALKQGANAVGGLAKAFANIAKQLGPILSSLLQIANSLYTQILQM